MKGKIIQHIEIIYLYVRKINIICIFYDGIIGKRE